MVATRIKTEQKKKEWKKKNETENERKKIRSIDILDKQDLHLACLLAK